MRRTALQTAVHDALDRLGAPRAGECVVVALSGGPDSMALLDALVRAGASVVAAHVDHGLRAESPRDLAFCQAHCAARGIPFHATSVDARQRARADHRGLEDAARSERYAFLREVAKRAGAAWIAVAHTRDDQAETLLLRLLRGSGRSGLSGMRERSAGILRPLLEVSRAQVLAHLAAYDLAWCDDASNSDPAFLRNRVRHELIPYLESRFNPSLRESLARSARVLADEADALDGLAAQVPCETQNQTSVLPLPALREAPRAVARLALRQALAGSGGLREVGFGHVESLLRLACSRTSSGRRLALPGGREASFDFDRLTIGARVEAAIPFAAALSVPGRVELPGGSTLVASPAARRGRTSPRSAVVAISDAPLCVRTRRPGDRVRAHGRDMSLKRFLMGRKVPAQGRGALPMVASGDRILWIPGQMIDDRLAGSRLVRLEILGLTKEAS